MPPTFERHLLRYFGNKSLDCFLPAGVHVDILVLGHLVAHGIGYFAYGRIIEPEQMFEISLLGYNIAFYHGLTCLPP